MCNTFDDIQALVKKHGIKMIDFKEIDLDGRWHHLTIPIERFTPDLLEKGIGFDGSSYGFLTVEKSDMVFIPDVTSAFVDPIIEIPTISMIGDIYRISDEYVRFESDPRYIAEKAERFMKDANISDNCLFGPEFEFYVLDNIEFRNEINHIEVHLDSVQADWNTIDSPYDDYCNNKGYKVMGHKGYHADLPYDASFDLRNKMVRTLEDYGIPVKYHHSENGGPGQVEIEVEFASLKEMADRSQKLKYLIKNIAIQNGKTVTFMPKPFHGECGSGMHVHFQMFNGGNPIFYDENGYSNLSDTALHAISGILQHSAALTAFCCPSTNSYKRLVPGYEAPVTICFATSNRSSVIRIPGYARKPEDKRFEFRPSDATANPYLCFAAIAMAAVDGIQKKSDPTSLGFGPYDKNMYYLTDDEKKIVKSLPKSLGEAADALEKDYDFLLNGGVFSMDLINSQLKKIRKDALDVNNAPHPLEFKKYYDL
ncbi:MAG: type I glutamate--ammonia ligase [Eubacterium sp.]|jgi:glutamine synthetase|nr:type I glutamate--ammonia ligase [Eubacterium sp.]